ncbi:MAG: 3-isopropylmalate dehydratase large subunit [Acidobacteria bacterium]|nr:3-isopropylmalate dehydratase large subunit [Acidobacteriota bacterium]
MKQTAIEKIISNHSDHQVKAGEIVWMKLDVRSARDFGGANVVKNLKTYYPGQPLDDLKKTFFTFDTVVPANNIPYANNQQICRDYAEEMGIKVYDVNAGIGSHVMIEEGRALPGYTLVGTDSHLNIFGAVGAFGQGMGDQDIAFAFRNGFTWFEVPESMRIILNGEIKYPVSAKDVVLAVLERIGSKGALGRAIEFTGSVVDRLDLAGRITLASMVTEMGGIIGLISPNKAILDELKKKSGHYTLEPIVADEGAEYVETIEMNLNGLEPMIAAPPKPDNVVKVSSLKKVAVDSIFIGSCTNGRTEDFKVAADILRGRKVHPKVMMKIVPATRRVFTEMLKLGIVQELHEAGAIISNPGCGGCASGQIGMTGKGEVQVSTSNRNFLGKQGDGETYLASPAVAAASAITGYITAP